MRKARQVDDPILMKIILRKLAGLGTITTTGGCTVIPFPTTEAAAVPARSEQPLWWVLVKLTLAIPGSLTALLLLSKYAHKSSWSL